MKIMIRKVYFAFIAMVLMTGVTLVNTVEATNTPPIDGSVSSFGFNNTTIISGVMITNTAGNEIDSGVGAAADLTRLNDFILQFDVYDIDGFSNLDVYVVFFNTNSSSKETESGVMLTAINSGVNDRGLVVRWIAPERGEYLSGLSVTESETYEFPVNSGADTFLVKSGTTPISSGTYNSGVVDFVSTTDFNNFESVTWTVDNYSTSGTSTVLQSGVVNDFDAGTSGVRNIQYRVTIPFKLSKVAPSSGVWNVGVMVHDKLQQEIDLPNTGIIEQHFSFSPEYFNQWYGEVSIVGNSGISFTDVPAGGGFQSVDQSGVASGIQVRFTSNGTYNQQIQSDTTWRPAVTNPARPAFAYLIFDSGLDATTGADKERLDQEGNRFALQARRIKLGDADEDLSADWINIVPFEPTQSNITNSGLVPDLEDLSLYQEANENQVPIGSPKSSRIGPINFAEGTTEQGVVSIFEFQLRLSSVFQNTTYRGKLTIGVSNVTTSDDFFTTVG